MTSKIEILGYHPPKLSQKSQHWVLNLFAFLYKSFLVRSMSYGLLQHAWRTLRYTPFTVPRKFPSLLPRRRRYGSSMFLQKLTVWLPSNTERSKRSGKQYGNSLSSVAPCSVFTPSSLPSLLTWRPFFLAEALRSFVTTTMHMFTHMIGKLCSTLISYVSFIMGEKFGSDI